MNTAQLAMLIKQAGRRPVERDTVYNEIKDYTEVVFSDEELLTK